MNNSINMITAITENGLKINMLKCKSTNDKIFIIFFDCMLSYLKEIEMNPEDIGIIFDNCPIHRGRLVREYYIKDQSCTSSHHTLRNWLQLRSIYSIIKHSIVQEILKDTADLKTEESISIIADYIHNISCEYIKRLWSRLINIVEEELEKI